MMRWRLRRAGLCLWAVYACWGLAGCESREGEQIRQGLDDAGREIGAAARKVADAIRAER